MSNFITDDIIRVLIEYDRGNWLIEFPNFFQIIPFPLDHLDINKKYVMYVPMFKDKIKLPIERVDLIKEYDSSKALIDH